MHCPNVRARTATPVSTADHVGDAGHVQHPPAVADPLGGAVERGGPADHGRQRALHVEVGGELLAPGHRGERVDPVPRGADHGEVRGVLQLDLDLPGGGAGRLRRQLAVRHGRAVGGGDHAVLGRQELDAVAEHDRRGVEERTLGDGGGDAHRGVRRDGGVGAAGELVEHQLRTRGSERHRDLLQRQVELLGDQHRRGRGDALADLGAGQCEGRGAVLVDRHRDQVGGRPGGVGERVVEVVQLGRLRAGRDLRGGRLGEAEVGGRHEGGAAHHETEETAASHVERSGRVLCLLVLLVLVLREHGSNLQVASTADRVRSCSLPDSKTVTVVASDQATTARRETGRCVDRTVRGSAAAASPRRRPARTPRGAGPRWRRARGCPGPRRRSPARWPAGTPPGTPR